jgi:hypothetical protein
MNTQQQAYIEGFVKRASEYGFSEAEAIELLKQSDWYDTLQGGLNKLQTNVIDPASNFVNKNVVQPVQKFFAPTPDPFDPANAAKFNANATRNFGNYANRDRSQDAPAGQAPLRPASTGQVGTVGK